MRSGVYMRTPVNAVPRRYLALPGMVMETLAGLRPARAKCRSCRAIPGAVLNNRIIITVRPAPHSARRIEQARERSARARVSRRLLAQAQLAQHIINHQNHDMTT